jgi:tetratricopeptide (TPR) repeat protein
MTAQEKIERAKELYERAVFGGDSGVLADGERDLDAVEADVTLARGRLVHARFLAERVEDPRELELFERAARLYEELGDIRGQGEAMFWIGIVHQVVRGDGPTAVPLFERSLQLATQAGDALTQSYALRHLGIAEQAAGRPEAARERLEESSRLRRELGFLPGVAANMIGLAYLAAAEERRADALAILDDARTLAEDSQAYAIVQHIDEARADLQ